MNFQCFVISVLRGWYPFDLKAFLVFISFADSLIRCQQKIMFHGSWPSLSSFWIHC